MKYFNNQRICFLVVVAFLLGSCSSSKNLSYLQDLNFDQNIGEVQKKPEYVIKVNDNLHVSIQSLNPEINKIFDNSTSANSFSTQRFTSHASQFVNGYLVNSVGEISLPVLGVIKVAGLTRTQSQIKVQIRANEYLKDATVDIKLLNFKVSVMGEVTRPGLFYIYNNDLTVLEAISMASGTTEYSKIQNVVVVRTSLRGRKAYKIDLTKQGFLNSPAFYLQPDDIVYVEPRRRKLTERNTVFYSLFLSAVSTLILVLNLINN